MDIYKLVLSKWFSYFAIASLLICFWFFVIPYFLFLGIINGDLALNLISEIWGLFFTLGIFIVMLEYRDWLVWKKIKKKVMKRIGMQIQAIFIDISDLCVVDVPIEAFESNRYRQKELEELLTNNIILRNSWKEKERSLSFAKRFESLWKGIGIIDSRHGKFLSSDIQCSLLDIEDSLHKLLFEFYVTDFDKDDREMFITTELKKIVKEIDYLRKNGIDVGF